MEPVRVKVYGLLSRTRKRYVRDSVIGLIALAVMLLVWFPCWPLLKERIETVQQQLQPPVLPTWMIVTVVVLEVLPWILLATALFKCLEMYLVLRCFTRKEAEQLRQGIGPTPSDPA